jgi:hypothetical protein
MRRLLFHAFWGNLFAPAGFVFRSVVILMLALNTIHAQTGHISSAFSSPSDSTSSYNAITGQGSLIFVGPASNCVTNVNVYITNFVTRMVGGGSNATMNVTFTIGGGLDGYAYDVFANSALGSGTNSTAWAWMGQGYHCSTYMLTNFPNGGAFIVLGTPQDSDADGLTDAYELLASHTNPTDPDTDGDGLSDAAEVLWGLNPLFNEGAQPSFRSNYNYDLADWLEGISGVRTGVVNLDNEGNVLSVSQ